jgi:NADH dehydrogenase/NADH:ubiquinone oxidoreductase subunit G
MVKLTIDDKAVEAQEGETILEAARRYGIYIPTLCHHPAVTAYGGCRLCLVEAFWGKKSKLVVSCIYTVEEGGIFKTNTERVQKSRRLILELLLARCPEVEAIKELAGRFGVVSSRFRKGFKDCALCGLCTRVCQELIGKSAIGFSRRGVNKEVSTPFHKGSDPCLGCEACAYVCPTGAIKFKTGKKEKILTNWETVLTLKECSLCGQVYAPLKEIEHLKNKLISVKEFLDYCPVCRRKEMTKKIEGGSLCPR